jgi:hypothetical protein
MRRTGLVIIAVVALSGCAFVLRASQRSGPHAPPGNGASGNPSISASGRFVAFDSVATDLVAGDTNGVRDVFVRDVVNRVTTRVSVTTDGGQATGASRNPSISDDGRLVAFETAADDLVAGDDDTVTDIAVHDRVAGTTELVSVGHDPEAVDPIVAGQASIVAFTPRVPVPGVGFCCVPIGPAVRDLTAGTTTLLSGGIRFGDASISDDGARIAFGTIVPQSSGDASFDARVVEVATGELVVVLGSGILTHQSQATFALGLSGDGGSAAWFLGNAGAGEVSIVDVDDPSQPPEVVASLGGVRALRLSDPASTLMVWTSDGGASAVLVRTPDDTGLRGVATDGVGTPVDAVTGADLAGDGAWLALAVAGGAMMGDDTNGAEDVYVRSVGASLHGPT